MRAFREPAWWWRAVSPILGVSKRSAAGSAPGYGSSPGPITIGIGRAMSTGCSARPGPADHVVITEKDAVKLRRTLADGGTRTLGRRSGDQLGTRAARF